MQKRMVDGIGYRPLPERSPQPKRRQKSPPASIKFRPAALKPPLRVLGVVLALTALFASTLLITNQRRLRTALTFAAAGVESLNEGFASVLTEPMKARAAFDVGANSFAATAAELQNLDSFSKSLLIFPYAREGVQLVRLAYHASLAGQALSTVLADKPAAPAPQNFEEAAGNGVNWLLASASGHTDELETALTHLNSLRDILSQLDIGRLPRSLRTLVTDWQTKLPTTVDQLRAVADIVAQSPALFAANQPTRFVILFQNNTELRPTGGFIGSYASAEFTDGQLSDFFVQTNVYKSDLAFSTQHPITPPFPISEATTVWGMRDANWAVDFRDSANQVLAFYQGIYGQPAHGVIAIDTTVITDLLELTGPIDFPEYKTTLTAQNFVDVVQYKVEKEYFENRANKIFNEPKQIIADFIPKLFTRLSELPAEKQAKIWRAVADAMARKSLLAYSANDVVERALVKLDIAGHLKETAGDYLHINNANIGGGKSSGNMEQTVTVKQRPLSDVIETTLTITRRHTGSGEWPDMDNNNYSRIFIPKGSILMRTDGAFELHEVSEQGQFTVIEGWFNTPIASKRYAEITYQLPTRIQKKDYSLLLQRQPGENPTTFTFDSPLINSSGLTLARDSLLQ